MRGRERDTAEPLGFRRGLGDWRGGRGGGERLRKRRVIGLVRLVGASAAIQNRGKTPAVDGTWREKELNLLCFGCYTDLK
jgi:hypothetical protein